MQGIQCPIVSEQHALVVSKLQRIPMQCLASTCCRSNKSSPHGLNNLVIDNGRYCPRKQQAASKETVNQILLQE